jgi:TolB-like protein/DNA-binding winged helix-turn-helix (wHTH) protein/tetratricopeptide (TPR) repeat protein
MPENEVPRRYRFGAFEVDFRAGQLRRAGLRIRLSGQPIQILEALLERPGEVVTREELRARLWQADTFVDFEHNLNSAMKRLRAALGDVADVPRFIETLPRRGYRFLAPVEIVDASEPATAVPSEPAPPEPDPPMAVAAGGLAGTAEERPRRRAGLLVATLVVAAVLLSVVAFQWMRSPASDAPSVVVLPFVAGNASEGSPDDFVAFGMTDALIGELSRVSSLSVISQTSAMQYKSVRKPLPQIARELGVNTVVEGSVIHEGARVRITVQLIDARTDTHLWSQTYTPDSDTIVSTQRTLAREVAGLIRSRLVPSDHGQTLPIQRTNAIAYEAYVKGRYFLQRPGEASAGRAREYFEAAIDADAGFAPAYVGLAHYYVTTDSLAAADAMPKARASAARALELDDSLGTAHAAMAFVHYFWDWDWAAAETAFARAIALDPGDVVSRRWHALYLSSMGRHAMAIEEVQRAIALDPVSIGALDTAGAVWSNARRPDKVLEVAERIRDLSPEDPRGFLHLAISHLHRRRFADAAEALQRGTEIAGRDPGFLCLLAVAQHRGGELEAARQTMAEVEQLATKGYVPDWFLAIAYLWLGDHEAALDRLYVALAHRDGYLVVTKVAPSLDPLRGHPRFQALLDVLRFPA